MKIYTWFILLLFSLSFSQTEDAWVFLHDKPDYAYYFSNPLEMLSERALQRRERYGIDLDIRDVPVDEDYLNLIASSSGISVVGKSKWLNALHVQGDVNDMQSLLQFQFVDSIRFANRNIGTLSRAKVVDKFSFVVQQSNATFGNDTVPYVMHRAHVLHEEGFAGKDVLIAVIDAGFISADTSRVLKHVFADGRVVDHYNFPDREPDVFKRHYHGTVVWVRIAGYDEENYRGTAFDAKYCLYISEDVTQEMPVEETYWAMAAERADSVGVDVINTSLGYSVFDRPEYNYTRADMDGETAFVSRAAQIATEKGIHVVVSAGNSGYNSWRIISAPADARDVIAVGAVNAHGDRTGFSSTGNTADGRIKPDVMSWGSGVKTFFMGNFVNLNGTSFSAPVITGFVADLVQAFPLVSPVKMKQILLESSDRFHQPDSLYGFGIPDFSIALDKLNYLSENQLENITFYPNPADDVLMFSNLYTPVDYTVFDVSGKMVRQGKTYGRIDIRFLQPGTYFLLVTDGRKFRLIKWIKKP